MKLHGKTHNVVWTKLNSDAEAGTNKIQLSEVVDWEVGMDIIITPTSMDPRQTERHVIAEIQDDGLTLITRDTLRNLHLCRSEELETNVTYSHCAEVGLLTRNIKISSAPSENFYGGRLLIGLRMLQSRNGYDTFRGIAKKVLILKHYIHIFILYNIFT